MRPIDADALCKKLQAEIGSPEGDEKLMRINYLITSAPTIEPERKKGIPMDAIKYILRKETVTTNPENFVANEKFIQFMTDPEIASFGRWQHSNGFNTALVAVECELDKIPNAEPERKKGEWVQISPAKIYECTACKQNVMTDDIECYNFCPNCGADMRGEQNG